MAFKQPKIGVYQNNDRALQKRLSYERVSLTWHPVIVYKYLGSEVNDDAASLLDIQDTLFMENPDRSYDPNGIQINAHVEQLPETPFDLSKFGIINPLEGVQVFRIHVSSFDDEGMGRYIVTGDVIEVPFFQKDDIKAFFEVTDVDKKTEFENFHVVVTTVPIKDVQEMEEIPGMVSNSDIMDELQSDLDDAYERAVSNQGLNAESDLFVVRGYVEDGYIDPASSVEYSDESTGDYDPRSDLASDFLDNPNAKTF